MKQFFTLVLLLLINMSYKEAIFVNTQVTSSTNITPNTNGFSTTTSSFTTKNTGMIFLICLYF